MIGVFLMHTGQCERCEVVSRDLLVLRGGPWRQTQTQDSDHRRKGAMPADEITVVG